MIRQSWRWRGAAVMLVVLAGSVSTPAGAATDFAAEVFRFQWDSVEANTPNFWGPLANATNGTTEPYLEAAGGQRLVQYFDKARMEQAGPNTVTNGLLTVELKSGRLQTGNDRFEQRVPATIGIAGDPGVPGPTYADLARLPERVNADPGVALTTTYVNGQFTQSNVLPTDPNLALTQYVSDPGGRFGQYVPRAFIDYLNRLPLPYTAVMGYPITPAFGAQLIVGGVPRPVFIQAFERRVLTYTPGNPRGFEVEFGNIGQHYYQWRYITPMTPPPGPTPPVSIATPAPQPPLRPVAPAIPNAGGVDTYFAAAVTTLVTRTSSALPLGNATGAAFSAPLSYQPFENGTMFYYDRKIYVLSKTGVQLTSFPDTFVEDNQPAVLPGPRPNTFYPARGFGKVYRENPGVSAALGLALAPERGYASGKVQLFERGILLDDVNGTTVYALNLIAGTWDTALR